MAMIMILTTCNPAPVFERREAAKAEISTDISNAIKKVRKTVSDSDLGSCLLKMVDLGLLFPKEDCLDVILGKFLLNPWSSVSYVANQGYLVMQRTYPDAIRANVHGICLDCARGRIHPVQPGCHNNQPKD